MPDDTSLSTIEIGEAATTELEEETEGGACVRGIALEALHDVGEDRLVVGARDLVGRAGRDHLGDQCLEVAQLGVGEGVGRHSNRVPSLSRVLIESAM